MARKSSGTRTPRNREMSAADVALVASADQNVRYRNGSTMTFDEKIRNLPRIDDKPAYAKELP